MSIKIVPPFQFVPRISSTVDGNIYDNGLKQLRNVVLGKEDAIPRASAMELLLDSDFPNKHRDFEAVLENENESAEIRYLAALYLSKMNTPVASDILIKNTVVRNERALFGVVRALGRIGDQSAMGAISKVQEKATELLAKQARFAMALISHRQGLKGSDLPLPKGEDYLEVASSLVRPMQVSIADGSDGEICLRSIAGQPFGIEFAERPMYQMRCGRNVWMMLFNRECSSQDAVRKLTEHKAFPGAIALRSEETSLYSLVFLILTSPGSRSNEVNILVHHTNGDLVFGGTGQVERDRATFSIRSVSRPGGFPIHIEGTFEGGELDVKTALAGVSAQVRKRQPIRSPRSVRPQQSARLG